MPQPTVREDQQIQRRRPPQVQEALGMANRPNQEPHVADEDQTQLPETDAPFATRVTTLTTGRLV